jgi:hypothetical protein
MVSQFILWADLIARRLLRSNSMLLDGHINTAILMAGKIKKSPTSLW